MKVTGIIAEYDPFHKGHLYHLQKTRQETGADYVVIVMSGDLTQRGTPALIDKYIRTQMALSCGADLVLELPVIHATGSAPYFARGAVALLHNLQAVDCLCFGSENGELEVFRQISRVMRQELPAFKKSLRKNLSDGRTFPLARHQALADCLGDIPLPDGLLDSPNNILGMEYCMALQEFASPIQPFIIQRQGSAYHQTELGKKYSSATAIRQAISQGTPFSEWSSHLPKTAAQILGSALQKRGWIQENDFSLLLKYKCMETPPEKLCLYFDVSKEMANRIHKCLNSFTDYRDFITRIKTREITYTRAARGLLHILLDLYQPPLRPSAQKTAPYARILGFRREAAPLLAQLKKASRIPLISRPAKSLKNDRSLEKDARTMLEQDIHAANVYESVLAHKSRTPFVHEACRPVVLYSDHYRCKRDDKTQQDDKCQCDEYDICFDGIAHSDMTRSKD